jgi:glycosyltransferase involved in cell wall biosynthesis
MTENGALPHPVNVLEVLGNAIVGGMENYVSNLLTHLPSDEFQVTLLVPFESPLTDTLRKQGYDVHVTAMADDPPWRSIQTAVSLVREYDIHLIHAHLPVAHVLSGIAGSLTRRPVVATMHTMSLKAQELGIYRLTGSHLVLVCQHAYTQARSLGIPAHDMTLIYNGVDITRFSPDRDARAFRRQVGIPEDAPLAGFVGRLSPEKGPDLFVRAAHFAAERHSTAHFVLVGTGPMEGELHEMIGRLGLADRVHLAGLREDVSAVYPAFDILAQTSHMEGTPLALLEGMSCGLPTVALGVGGVIEIVEVGTTGLLYGPGDWEGIGWGMLSLFNDPQSARRMGQAARERVLTHFSIDGSAARTAGLFRRLVARDRYKRLSLPDTNGVPEGHV